MTDEVVGIPLLAAAAMSAPPRRFALLMANAALWERTPRYTGTQILDVAKEWAAWLEEGEPSMGGPEHGGPGLRDDGVGVDFDLETETRPGVQSFGRP